MRIYDILYFDKLLLQSSIQTANGIQWNARSLELYIQILKHFEVTGRQEIEVYP
jgi:hypothetical protein